MARSKIGTDSGHHHESMVLSAKEQNIYVASATLKCFVFSGE